MHISEICTRSLVTCTRDTPAAELMCANLETVRDSELIYDAIWHMRKRQVLRLPVVDAHGGLVGVLTADDVAEFLASELGELSRVRKRHPTPLP